ncbi:unnamed protein product [Chrysoparadoxa australica]
MTRESVAAGHILLGVVFATIGGAWLLRALNHPNFRDGNDKMSRLLMMILFPVAVVMIVGEMFLDSKNSVNEKFQHLIVYSSFGFYPLMIYFSEIKQVIPSRPVLLFWPSLCLVIGQLFATHNHTPNHIVSQLHAGVGEVLRSLCVTTVTYDICIMLQVPALNPLKHYAAHVAAVLCQVVFQFFFMISLGFYITTKDGDPYGLLGSPHKDVSEMEGIMKFMAFKLVNFMFAIFSQCLASAFLISRGVVPADANLKRAKVKPNRQANRQTKPTKRNTCSLADALPSPSSACTLQTLEGFEPMACETDTDLENSYDVIGRKQPLELMSPDNHSISGPGFEGNSRTARNSLSSH